MTQILLNGCKIQFHFSQTIYCDSAYVQVLQIYVCLGWKENKQTKQNPKSKRDLKKQQKKKKRE